MKKIIWVESLKELQDLAALHKAKLYKITETLMFPCEVGLIGNENEKMIVI